MGVKHRGRINSRQVIIDLLSCMSEEQLLKYTELIGLQKYIFDSTKYEKLTNFIINESKSTDEDRTQQMRDKLMDFILEDAIPPIGGMRFQEQVARWFKLREEKVSESESVRGALTHQKYHDVDIHITRHGLLSGRHIWVETKVTLVDRPVIEKLERSATSVHLAKHRGSSTWAPDMLVVVSLRGFTDPAIELANSRGIYCIRYMGTRGYSVVGKSGKRYYFVGKMSEDDYTKGVLSSYSIHPSAGF